jgi:catechol 2,3-dioxygenase-like lactoylglutathione lyase family enzyme
VSDAAPPAGAPGRTGPYDGAVLVAVLPVADLDRSEAWYGRLGFTAVARHDDYLVLRIDELELHLLLRPDEATGGPTESWSGAYLRLADAAAVDPVHAAWSAGGAHILAPPVDRPWGMRQFDAEDPDGNRWGVGALLSDPSREAGPGPADPGGPRTAAADPADPGGPGTAAADAAGLGTAPTDGSPGTTDDAWRDIVATGPCAGCGLTATDGAATSLAGRVRDEAHRWGGVLTGADDEAVRRRPAPGRWSALEYGAHVRDTIKVFTERTMRALVETDPELGWWDHEAAIEDGWDNESDVAAVVDDLAENAGRFGEVLDRVPPDGWDRTATRRGEPFTIEDLARYALHEVVHHRVDAERSLAAADPGA